MVVKYIGILGKDVSVAIELRSYTEIPLRRWALGWI